MAVEVLLMDEVKGLGIEGDVVKVADGYARNYLFPRGIAAEVTEGKKRQIRRMCELVGLKVVGLKRVRIGNVMLGNLPPGQWRCLGQNESF